MDHAGLHQLHYAPVAETNGTGVDGEVLDPGELQSVHDGERVTLCQKTPDGDTHPRLDVGDRLVYPHDLVLRHGLLL